MKNILARSNQEILAQFASSHMLLGLDYDGTLAPIVDDPAAANLRPRTRELLEQVAQRYPCVLISGRSQADALRRVRGLGMQEVIGNHGLESWRRTTGGAATVQRWIPMLRAELGALRGVIIEDKIFSLAIHYRQCREKNRARRCILAAVHKLAGVRVLGGKLVVNLLAAGAPHKGMALTAARDRLRCDTALYIGDDETDEDVFALDDPGRLLTIRVGASRLSRAAFCIRDQQSIDRLLAALLAMRPSRVAAKRKIA
jgi:trehalose 6-phosphate phosphatase